MAAWSGPMQDSLTPAVPAHPAHAARPRRFLRRAAASAVVVFAVLLAAAWLLPLLTDWTARRADIATLSAARLGRSVTLEGPVRLRLLPEPVLEAQGVTLGSEDEDIALGARALRIRLGLGALLAGRLEPREIVLIGADIRLPWPPPPFAALLLPGEWAGRLDILLEDSSIRLGGLALPGLAGRIAAGGGGGTSADLVFSWGGQRARLAARIAPVAPDFSAPVDLDVAAGAARVRLRGALLPEGSVEAEADAILPDLSALLPAPPIRLGGFGRLLLRGEEIRAERLSLDLGGAPASGSVTLRLGDRPGLAVSLDAARIDLDPWLSLLDRLRQGVGTTTLALSAEAASLGGVPLRRLRAEAAAMADGRVTISALSAFLPGDALLTAAGTGRGGRLDLSGRLVTSDLRGLLAGAGAPEALLSRLPPAALRWAGLDWRATVEPGQVALPELAGRLDGAAVSGAATLRLGARPALGLGLTFDRLDLGLYRPRGLGAAEALSLAAGIDADLRVSAERVSDGALLLERASLDAALSEGRLLVRRAAATLGGAQATLTGQVLPPERAGGPLRIAEFAAEAAAPSAAPLLRAALPALGLGSAALPPIAAAPVSLRLSGAGPADALALTLSGEIEALRVEGAPRLDLVAGGVSGPITLRHPGAARLATLITAEPGWDWLGEGSFSLVANGSLAPGRWSADAFDMVAGEARLSGALSGRPAEATLSGRVVAEILPLPLPTPGSPAPLPFALLHAGQAEVEITAGRVLLRGGPELADASARLTLEAGRLRLDRIAARLAGGSLTGSLAFGLEGWAPRLALSVRIAGAALARPLFGLPLDLGAGQFDLAADLVASGYSMAGLAAGLDGEMEVSATNGVLIGFDLPAAALAAGLADRAAAAGGLGAALSSGATAFERLTLTLGLADGRARIASAHLLAEGSIAATAEGGADLSRRLLDLRIEARAAEGAPFALRLLGAAEAPQRMIEIPDALRPRAGGG